MLNLALLNIASIPIKTFKFSQNQHGDFKLKPRAGVPGRGLTENK